MTGESVTGRYHDSLSAEKAADLIEGDLVQKEARPRVSDETSTAMQTMQLQDQSGADKMSQEGFLAKQRLLNATKTQPEEESALSRASQGVSAVSDENAGIMNIPDMPKQDAKMSTDLAMQKSRDQIKKFREGNSLGKMPTVAGSYSGNENDPAMPTVPEQSTVDSSIKNAMRRSLEQKSRGMKQEGQEGIDQADRDRRAIIENMYKTGDEFTRKDIEKNFGGKKIDYQKTFGGEGVSSSSYDPVEQFLRGSKRSDITLQERMARQDAENEKLIAEDPSRGSVSIPYAGHGQGKAPSEEQASSRNPALSMFNTPEEYERLAKEEASFLKELQGESISPDEVATLQEERRKSWDADPSTLEEKTIKFDAEKPVPKKIAQLPREEKTAAKEANGTHVRDESTGFTLNLSRLKKSFKRQEHFAMLKHIPQENRAAMLAEWGYIDPDELTVAQKKSALELQKLENAKILGAKHRVDLEKAKKSLKGSLTEVEQNTFNLLNDRYKAASEGDPPNFSLMKSLDAELGELNPAFKTDTDYNKAEKQYLKKKHDDFLNQPLLTRVAKELNIDVKQYRDHAMEAQKIGQGKLKGVSGIDAMMAIQVEDQGSVTSFGEMVRRQGFPAWEDVERLQATQPNNPELIKMRNALGLPEGQEIQPQAYMGWAQGRMVDAVMMGIYGDGHRDMQNAMRSRTQQLKDNVNNPNATQEEKNKKLSVSEQIQQPVIKKSESETKEPKESTSNPNKGKLSKLEKRVLRPTNLREIRANKPIDPKVKESKLKKLFSEGEKGLTDLVRRETAYKASHPAQKGKVKPKFKSVEDALNYFDKVGIEDIRMNESVKYFILKSLEDRKSKKKSIK